MPRPEYVFDGSERILILGDNRDIRRFIDF